MGRRQTQDVCSLPAQGVQKGAVFTETRSEAKQPRLTYCGCAQSLAVSPLHLCSLTHTTVYTHKKGLSHDCTPLYTQGSQ